MKSNDLRRKHPVFIYQSFQSQLKQNQLQLSFTFLIEPDISFNPKIIIEQVNRSQIERLGSVLANFVFHLGLAEIPSYWKATCSPTIKINCGYLNPEQIHFWHKLLIKGMGQFYYTNKIDFTKKDLVEIISSPSPPSFPSQPSSPSSPSYLVPLGGGKDSIVTLEILQQSGLSVNLCMTNPPKASLQIAKIAGFKNPIIVKRIIDPELLHLNKKGYLNGHVPITASLSFLYMLVAALFGYKHVVFSNEASSNEANLVWKGTNINHQYSKSLEFENDFRHYCRQFLTDKINYFSLLRPLYELQITRLFTQSPQFTQYSPIFRSCNAGQKTNSWCGRCPKCLSVFLHLSPFLTLSTLFTIFGKNLYQDKSLLPTFKQLLGVSGHKPFECVGTIEENRAAAWLALNRFPRSSRFTLLQFTQEYLTSINYNQKKADLVLKAWGKNHHLPEKIEMIVKGQTLQRARSDLKKC